MAAGGFSPFLGDALCPAPTELVALLVAANRDTELRLQSYPYPHSSGMLWDRVGFGPALPSVPPLEPTVAEDAARLSSTSSSLLWVPVLWDRVSHASCQGSVESHSPLRATVKFGVLQGEEQQRWGASRPPTLQESPLAQKPLGSRRSKLR